jgi:hypothetical protein
VRLRTLSSSMTLRALAAIGVIVGAYVALHAHFATFDAALARHVLAALGFATSSNEPGTLHVQAGTQFNVYAIVTGACSSAAGALGITAVALVLLPGRLWRRVVGGGVAVLAFATFNIARIVSIILFGWWLAVESRPVLLVSLGVPALLCLAVVVLPHRGVLTRVGALLAGGFFGVLAYDAARGYDYSVGMVSYHAIAGPVLTFGTLAITILFLWRIIAGPERITAPTAPATS